MNILYLHTHDTGRCLEPYGFQVPTPRLMELARDSVVFRNAYCCGPTCSPSRAALVTGKYPHQNGMWGLAHRGFSLNDPAGHLAAYFGAHGYETALAGIQHEAVASESLGYQRILGDPVYSMGKMEKDWKAFDIGNAHAAAGFIAGPHDRPFFLSLGLFNTHRPFPVPSDPRDEDFCQPFPHLRDCPETRKDMAAFRETVRIADEAAGIVWDALRASGHDGDTVVVVTTDHGPAFPGMKCTLQDTGIAVALIVRVPGTESFVSDALVSHLDVFPTLCQAAGIPEPEGLEGRSLLPLIHRETDEIHDRIVSEINFHVAYEPARCIRTKRYKYIRRFGAYPYPRLSNVDDSPTKRDLMALNGFAAPWPEEALYDLALDPLEQKNRTHDPAYADTLTALREDLRKWMIDTDDPLRSGPLKPPAGALVNPPESLSPSDKQYLTDTDNLQ